VNWRRLLLGGLDWNRPATKSEAIFRMVTGLLVAASQLIIAGTCSSDHPPHPCCTGVSIAFLTVFGLFIFSSGLSS
jgi:hypothetical protein